MKALLAQFIYEANTFCPQAAGLDNFQQGGAWRVGESQTRAWASAGDSQMKGSLAALEDGGWETAPVFAAMCGSPSGRLTAECFNTVRQTLRDQLRSALPADAVLLHLHGAACAEGEDDVEGNLLEMVRTEVGFNGRLVLSLDLHANVTRRMMEFADAMTAYHTMPHCDFHETGERAARLAMQTAPTVRAAAKIAALIPPTDTYHLQGRFADMLAQAREAEKDPDVDDVALLPVQPWLDIQEMGSAIVVTGRGDKPREVAHQLAEQWYAQRHAWRTGLIDWDTIHRKLQTRASQPWMLVDTADATNGGSPGHSAEALRRLLPEAHSLAGPVLLCVVDADTVAAAQRGERRFSAGSVGHVGEPPVELDAEVVHLGEGSFVNRGKVYHGMRFSMRGAAVLKHGQIYLVVSCEPTLGGDPAFYECVGLHPDAALAVQVKSPIGWRAGFDAEPERGLMFDGPGCTSLNFASLPFTGERRNLFPINENPPDPITLWQTTCR